MVILRPDAEDETRASILTRAQEIVTNDQGTWTRVDEWGKRRFAYEIDHMNEGYYYVLYFQAEPKTLDEVTRVFKITDAVVRAMPVRLDEPAPATATAAATTSEE